MILTFADSEEQLTVDSLKTYPQFMKYSYKTNTLVPVTENAEKTFAEKFFGALISFLKKLEGFAARIKQLVVC